MIKKSFITDCEGPLTLNDNAYEIAAKFIPNGDELFKIISKFDDYLVDIVKKPNYHAGDTLKLIVPFFKVVGLTNEDLINFSKENIFTVPGSKKTLNLANESMVSYIVSTSYGQYIQALSNFMDFPFENTYYTKLDLDHINLSESNSSIKIGSKSPKIIEEFKKIEEFRKEILSGNYENGEDYDNLERIFFEEIPKMEIAKLINSVKTVGGKGKQIAVEEIVAKHNLDKNGIIYAGDSITDVEPLKYVKDNGGLAISFNGNEYPLNVAEIAIISEDTIVTSILIDLYSRFNKDYVLDFIISYSKRGPTEAFEDFEVDYGLVEDFEELFKNKDIPIIEIISNENKDYLLEKSKFMRENIRGKDIGGLG